MFQFSPKRANLKSAGEMCRRDEDTYGWDPLFFLLPALSAGMLSGVHSALFVQSTFPAQEPENRVRGPVGRAGWGPRRREVHSAHLPRSVGCFPPRLGLGTEEPPVPWAGLSAGPIFTSREWKKG